MKQLLTEWNIKLNRRFNGTYQNAITIVTIFIILLMLMILANLYMKNKNLEDEVKTLEVSHNELKVDYRHFKDSTVVYYDEALLTCNTKIDSLTNAKSEPKVVYIDVLKQNGVITNKNGFTVVDFNNLNKYMSKMKYAFGVNKHIYSKVSIDYLGRNRIGTY